MNPTDDLSQQIDRARQEVELVKLQEELEKARLRNRPIELPIIEDPRKYGDLEDVKDDDRHEIEGILGIVDQSTPAAASPSITASAKPAKPKQIAKYRSPLKGHIRNCLTDDPDANDLSICGYLDSIGSKAIPKSWLNGNSELTIAYRKVPTTRAKVSSAFSKVRRDLRLTK
jgi:hypothetical protein